MANLRKWSSSASGNSSIAGGANTINFAEGQTPGSVNNSARELMAQVRSVYVPSEWGWVEFSATASVASQTSFKIAGNQTSDWTAGRRWRLKSGSSTRYGSVVSSSFTAETTITVTVDSGSLSASHSLAALAAIDSNHVPANTYVTSASLATTLGTYVTSSSLSTALGTYVTSNSMSAAIANFVTSASASTMIATQIAASPSAVVLLGSTTISNVNAFTISGSWSAYYAIELIITTQYLNTGNVGPQGHAYTDGGTSSIIQVDLNNGGTSATVSAGKIVTYRFFVTGVDNRPVKSFLATRGGLPTTLGVTNDYQSTATTGFINALRLSHTFPSSATMTNGVAFLYGYRNA